MIVTVDWASLAKQWIAQRDVMGGMATRMAAPVAPVNQQQQQQQHVAPPPPPPPPIAPAADSGGTGSQQAAVGGSTVQPVSMALVDADNCSSQGSSIVVHLLHAFSAKFYSEVFDSNNKIQAFD